MKLLTVPATALLAVALGSFVVASAQAQSPTQDLPDSPSAILAEKQRAAQAAQDAAAKAAADKEAAAKQAAQQAAQQASDKAKAAQQTSTAGASKATAPAGQSPSAASEAKASDAADDKLDNSGNPPPRTAEDNTAEGENTILRVTVDEVNLIFTASDKHNRFVKDLAKDEVRILDDGKPPARVSVFAAQTDLPLQVGLMIDASNSIRDRFKFEQEAAIEFLSQIVRPSTDKAFVIGFDETPEVTQDFTDSTEALSKGIRMLKPGGGTALYDALYFACRDKLLKAPPTKTAVRRAIILLTDGHDTASHVTREEAIDMAERAEVIIYVISTNITGSKGLDDKILERIADATGGRAFFPFKLEDVADSFTEIQDELRSQYRVSYRPVNFQLDGRYHKISIDAPGRKNIKVRARLGYYAPSAASAQPVKKSKGGIVK